MHVDAFVKTKNGEYGKEKEVVGLIEFGNV
jgi:hypothetical protein